MTKEAADGVHVLLVTSKAKHGIKYGLEELSAEADVHSVAIGSAGQADVPIVEIRKMLQSKKGMEMSSDEECEKEESDSESEEEDCVKGSKGNIMSVKKGKKRDALMCSEDGRVKKEDSDSELEEEECRKGGNVNMDIKKKKKDMDILRTI